MELSALSRRTARAILPTTAFILPPLAVFAPLGAAPLLTIAALGILVSDARRIGKGIAALTPLVGLLAALGLWATASASWSILPEHSLLEGIRFLALSAGGLTIAAAALAGPSVDHRRIGAALTVGVLLAALLSLIERFGHQPLTHAWLGIPVGDYLPLARFDRGVTVLVLALWPAVFAIGNKVMRGVLIIAVLAIAAVMSSAAALLAALVSLFVFSTAWFAPRVIAAAMICCTLGFGIAIPLMTPQNDTILSLHEWAPWIKWSGIHRLVIWRFGADRIAERPFVGWGMDASRGIPGGKTDINTILPNLHFPGGAEALPLHPHDAALQLQLELGLPGLVLGLAVIVWIIAQLGWQAPLDRAGRAGALALGAAALTIGMLSFGLWQAWWLSTIWLISTVFISLAAEERQ